MQVQQAFVVDGKVFASKAEALDYVRKPQVIQALTKVTEGDKDLAEWLFDHEESVEMAFETGTIRRVTKQDSKKLEEALAHVAAVLADDKKAAFLIENAAAVKESFRWPSVKRMDEAEKAVAARNTLVAASDGNEELAAWIIENKVAILEAYQAGKAKREVSSKAMEGLAAYRAKKAAEKAAAEANGAAPI